MNITHIARKDVPAVLLRAFPEYRGNSFKFEPAENLTLSDAYWDGGTRSQYRHVDMITGEVTAPHHAVTAPPQFGGVRASVTVEIHPGFVIAEHCIFCGRDLGVTFHVNPQNVAALLPAPVDTLPDDLNTALGLIAGLKSFARREYATRAGIDFDLCVTELQARGLVSANGGLTLAGKNAANNAPRVY